MRLVEALTKFELDDGQLSALASSNDDTATRALLTDAVEQWNESNAKKLERFSSIVVDSLIEFGTDSNSNTFLYFLENAEDSDIKQISRELAEELIDFCNNFNKSQIEDYLVDSRGLFTEGAKNIIYKLKILKIFLTPSELKKYKSESGKELTIDDLYSVSGKMKTTLEIKKLASKSYSDTPEDGRSLKAVMKLLGKRSDDDIKDTIKNWLTDGDVKAQLTDVDRYTDFVENAFTSTVKADIKKKESFLNNCTIANVDVKSKKLDMESVGNALADYEDNYGINLSKNKRMVKDLILEHLTVTYGKETFDRTTLIFYYNNVVKKNKGVRSEVEASVLKAWVCPEFTDPILKLFLEQKVSVGSGDEKYKFMLFEWTKYLNKEAPYV